VVSQPVCSWLTEQDTPERTDGAGAERELCGRVTRRDGWAGRADSQLPAPYRTAAAAARSACAAACVWSDLGATTRRASTRMKSAAQAPSTVAVYVVTKLREPCGGLARITRHRCRVSGEPESERRAAAYGLSLTRSLLSESQRGSVEGPPAGAEGECGEPTCDSGVAAGGVGHA
jgi:hypothetical protein